MLNFKNIALETNRVYHAVQQPVDLEIMEWNELKCDRCKTSSICQIHFSSVPTVVNQRGKFILTARIVDLFQVEKQVD